MKEGKHQRRDIFILAALATAGICVNLWGFSTYFQAPVELRMVRAPYFHFVPRIIGITILLEILPLVIAGIFLKNRLVTRVCLVTTGWLISHFIFTPNY